jgi:hypothetical protein
MLGQVQLHIYIHKNMYMNISVHIYMCVCIYIYIYVCIYTYIYKVCTVHTYVRNEKHCTTVFSSIVHAVHIVKAIKLEANYL